MDANVSELYGGFSGATFVPARYELGEGLVISQTYAHFMAPFLMAFAPVAPGKPHPAPWKAAKGGLAIDISGELFVPVAFHPENLDRLNTIWWIAALLRLKVTTALFVPVISTERFSSIPAIQQEPELWPIEIYTRRVNADPQLQPKIEFDHLEWLKAHWLPASRLLANETFSVAFRAVDSSIWNNDPDLALVSIWGALERLFSTSQQELRFRVSAHIAGFLESPGRARYLCFKRTQGLYDERSKAAHGGEADGTRALKETYDLARRALLLMVETRRIPTKGELEARLFGEDVGEVEPGTGRKQ
jgi:hypothetical protein